MISDVDKYYLNCLVAEQATANEYATQRNFEFQQYRYNKEHEKDMAIIEASRQVALEYIKSNANY